MDHLGLCIQEGYSRPGLDTILIRHGTEGTMPLIGLTQDIETVRSAPGGWCRPETDKVLWMSVRTFE
jgi:hypothetical protein